jgi:hypothetical protein
MLKVFFRPLVIADDGGAEGADDEDIEGADDEDVEGADDSAEGVDDEDAEGADDEDAEGADDSAEGADTDEADFFLACRRARAFASLRSSLVSNEGHVVLQNLRNLAPISTVASSSSLSVGSVCMRSFAKPCQ